MSPKQEREERAQRREDRVEKYSKIENKFDKDSSPKSQQGAKTAIDKIAEIHLSRLKLGEKFLSADVNQKTEITNKQRVILALLEGLADEPLKLSAKRCNRLNGYTLEPLRAFIDMFYTLGIPVGRKGRIEEVSVLKALFNDATSGLPPAETTTMDNITK